MSEYFIPNFKHKNTVYLKLNAPIYSIRKNPGRPKDLAQLIVQRPIGVNPRLNFTRVPPSFDALFKASKRQIVDKKDETKFSF